MSMPNVIYVIEEGEYSDYRVVGVFSSRENAEKVSQLTGGEVSEWPLDPFVDQVNLGRRLFIVEMNRDGNAATARLCTNMSFHEPTMVARWRMNQQDGFVFWGSAWATDETHAIKILNEKRVQYLATAPATELGMPS